MTDIELRQLIEDLCNKAGEDRGIKFQPESSGQHQGGEWEVERFSNTQDEITIVIRHWRNADIPNSEMFSIPYPESQDLRNEFVKRAAEKISILLESKS